MTTTQEYTVKDAIELTGMEERQILYRIRRNHVEARKLGWIWLISERGIEQLKGIKSHKRVRLPHGVEIEETEEE